MSSAELIVGMNECQGIGDEMYVTRNKTFHASRVSEGNKLFPVAVSFSGAGISITRTTLMCAETEYIPYKTLTNVHFITPFFGYSTVIFYSYGGTYTVHGFLKSDVMEMKAILEGR